MEFVCEMCGEKFAAVQKCKYNPPRFCPACKAEKKRAARACDPRYTGVGGHGDVLEAGR